jgi:16S rRNA G1207 methylase RsmC
MKNHPLKIYFQYEYKGNLVNFNTQYGVQSAKKIDTVSELIIQKVKIDKAKNVFIANAGYGSFGIPLALKHPKVSFELTDRDFINVGLIKENIFANKLTNCTAYLSDGAEQARSQDFDLIILNYNQQFGKEWFERFLSRAEMLLSKDGKLVVAVHKSIKEFAKRLIQEKFGQYEKIFHDNSYYILSN